MSTVLKTKLTKKSPESINLEIKKEDFESFCNAIGLYKKEFLEILDASEKNHKEGRVKERKSLYELIKKSN